MPTAPAGVESRIEEETARLRQRLEKWEGTAFDRAGEIMEGQAGMGDRMRAMIDDL